MNYALSIDWLSFFCTSKTGVLSEYVTESVESTFTWEYEKADHGTRHYKELITVKKDGEDIFEVQQLPCSSVLAQNSMIIKVCNRFLYSRGLFYYIDMFFSQQDISINNISRIDICTDFNSFANGLHPISLINKFLSNKWRHIGRGIGTAHFNHFSKRKDKESKSYLNYTGLSFGSKKSDCRAYLYNKSFELLTVKDKPHIRQLWRQAGLVDDAKNNVWRLEISISSKGMTFGDRATKEKITISRGKIADSSMLSMIYFAFVKSLFSFIKNRKGITNVTREPRIELFNGEPYIDRCILSTDSGGDRTERILIKQLWQLSEKYRGMATIEDEGITKIMASELAACTGLADWLADKKREWKQPTKK